MAAASLNHAAVGGTAMHWLPGPDHETAAAAAAAHAPVRSAGVGTAAGLGWTSARLRVPH